MLVEADRGLLRDRTDFSVIRYIKDTAGRSIHRASANLIPSIQGAWWWADRLRWRNKKI